MTQFRAAITMFTAEQGGRPIPFFDGYQPEINISGTLHKSLFTLDKGQGLVEPGSSTRLTVQVENEIAVNPGDSFEIHDTAHFVGTGIIE